MDCFSPARTSSQLLSLGVKEERDRGSLIAEHSYENVLYRMNPYVPRSSECEVIVLVTFHFAQWAARISNFT
jgi:hypothetical protein